MDKILLFLFLGIGVILDYKSDKISNWLCFSGGIIGIFLIWNQKGLEGIKDVITAIVIVLGILLPFWFLHTIGGGDVKLLMMASCYLGIHILELLMVAAVCSGIYGILLLGRRRNFQQRFALLMAYCRECVLQRTVQAYPFDKNQKEDRENGGIHLSYTIFAGYMIGSVTGIL